MVLSSRNIPTLAPTRGRRQPTSNHPRAALATASSSSSTRPANTNTPPNSASPTTTGLATVAPHPPMAVAAAQHLPLSSCLLDTPRQLADILTAVIARWRTQLAGCHTTLPRFSRLVTTPSQLSTLPRPSPHQAPSRLLHHRCLFRLPSQLVLLRLLRLALQAWCSQLVLLFLLFKVASYVPQRGGKLSPCMYIMRGNLMSWT
jgi:hypothetical protein